MGCLSSLRALAALGLGIAGLLATVLG